MPPHTALPPLVPLSVFTAWQLSGWAVPAVLSAAGYLLGVRRVHARGDRWPASRTACHLAGLSTLLLVTCGVVGVYAGTLFWVRAAQNVTLLMVVPMLCALGAPLTLVRDCLPDRLRRPLGAALRSRWARRATFPLVVTAVFVAPMPALYFTSLYPASLEHPVVGVVCSAGLLTAGWVYFWTRFRVDPVPRSDPYLLSLAISVVEVLLDGALGLVVWLGPLLAESYYRAVSRDWGPSLRTDQIVGAGVLWIGGDLVGLPFLAVVLRRMTREDVHLAREIDAELDEAEAAAESAEAGEPATGRLWWEDHPELAERFRRR